MTDLPPTPSLSFPPLPLDNLDLGLNKDADPARPDQEPLALPVELYASVLMHIVELPVLAKCCLVDRAFLELCRERLYGYVWVRPWETGADAKFRHLFRTLSTSPHLASLITRLDIRYYPLSTAHQWEDTCVTALAHCVNLQSLAWTRNTTLTSPMLEALATLPKLEKLEINGHCTGSYRAELLCELKGLKDLRLIMPDREVVGVLVELAKGLKAQGGGLEGLEIVGQDPKFVDDLLLFQLAPHLDRLKLFKLWGTAHVGPKGYFAVCRAAADNLEELGLEAVGWGDDEDLLDQDLYLERESLLTSGVRLKNLQTLSVSEWVFQRLLLPDRSRQEQEDIQSHLFNHGRAFDLASIRREHDFPRLGAESFLPPGLKSIHVSRDKSSAEYDTRMSAAPVIQAIGEMWPNSLERLWLGHFLLTHNDLAEIIEKVGAKLDTLMIRMLETKRNPNLLAQALAKLPSLRVFHLQAAAEARSPLKDYTMADLETVAQAAGSELEQIGFTNRVYAVRRRRLIAEDGSGKTGSGWRRCDTLEAAVEARRAAGLEASACGATEIPISVAIEVTLVPWNQPAAIPEIFQVWRG